MTAMRAYAEPCTNAVCERDSLYSQEYRRETTENKSMTSLRKLTFLAIQIILALSFGLACLNAHCQSNVTAVILDKR